MLQINTYEIEHSTYPKKVTVYQDNEVSTKASILYMNFYNFSKKINFPIDF